MLETLLESLKACGSSSSKVPLHIKFLEILEALLNLLHEILGLMDAVY